MNYFKLLFRKLFGITKKEALSVLDGRDIEEAYTSRPISGYEASLDDNYLIDIRGSYVASQVEGNVPMSYIAAQRDSDIAMPDGIDSSLDSKSEKKQTVKISVKPINILHELELPPRDIDLMGLDDKISILKMRKDLIKQKYAKHDIDGIIERMENRKKYVEHKLFFSRFNITTDEKVQSVLKKYNLVVKSVDIFVPELPDEVIKVMHEYQNYTLKMCNKKPIVLVIATADSFSDYWKKRDPIILAQSPFGYWYDILGAYDKEMLLLSEL